jgi:hypothetical protein
MAHYLTSQQVREKSGISRRQLARIAPSIHGAIRYDGCHWRFEDNDHLKHWINKQRIKRAERHHDDKAKRLARERDRGEKSVTSLALDASRNCTQILNLLSVDDAKNLSALRRQNLSGDLKPLINQMAKLLDLYEELNLPASSPRRSRLFPA